MNQVDHQYAQLIKKILDVGTKRKDRTETGTLSIFDHKMVFHLNSGFPLVSLKETRWKVAFLEMLWFLRGESDTGYLRERGCKLWDAWANEAGYLGPVYGVQWREWHDPEHVDKIDQIRNLIDGLKNNPHSRRHIVSAWNVSDLPAMALPPCHWAHQCYVTDCGTLDLKLFLRSSDVMLGLPFNIAQYALLTHLYARAADLKVGRLIVDIGDAHIYSNHIAAAHEVLVRHIERSDGARTPVPPLLEVKTENTDIDGYLPSDFLVHGYKPRPHIKLEVAV